MDITHLPNKLWNNNSQDQGVRKNEKVDFVKILRSETAADKVRINLMHVLKRSEGCLIRRTKDIYKIKTIKLSSNVNMTCS